MSSYLFLAYSKKIVIGVSQRVPINQQILRHKDASHFTLFPTMNPYKLKETVKSFHNSPYIDDYFLAEQICRKNYFMTENFNIIRAKYGKELSDAEWYGWY